ncbi:hypothetical protein GCM10027066_26570 [Dyella jejuensis]
MLMNIKKSEVKFSNLIILALLIFTCSGIIFLLLLAFKEGMLKILFGIIIIFGIFTIYYGLYLKINELLIDDVSGNPRMRLKIITVILLFIIITFSILFVMSNK